MFRVVIPAILAAALTACGGGGGGGSSKDPTSDNTPSQPSVALLISQYKNEISSGEIYNSSVADLNGDGLDDVVVSGWASAPSNWTGARSGFVNLKIFIQQDNGSLLDKTDELIGATNSVIWGSQRILINDYDNDGKPDIAVLGFQDGQSAVPAPSVVFWNDGKSFSRVELSEKVWAHAACAGDLNGDGTIELITGGSGLNPNTIYSNQGKRQFVFDRNLTPEGISSSGACAVIKDNATGNVGIVTTNMAWYPFFSAMTKIWDRNFNFVKTNPLPSSEEPGYNSDIIHDIVNLIPIDVNGDGQTDLITTDNGNWKYSYANGSMAVLINQGDFAFKDETEKYLPNQSKTSFFNYYYNKLTVDGYQSIYFDNANQGVSLWQIKNGTLVKYKEALLNSLAKGYHYTNIYKTKNGLAMFLIDTSDYPYAKFHYRLIPKD